MKRYIPLIASCLVLGFGHHVNQFIPGINAGVFLKWIDKNSNELQEMIFQTCHNWNSLDTHLKRGRCIVKEKYNIETTLADNSIQNTIRSRWVVDNNIPIFSQDKNYIEKLFSLKEV